MSVETHLARVDALNASKRHDDAVLAARHALSGDPDNFRAHMAHAVSLHYGGRDAEALPAVERAIALEPAAEWPHRVHSVVLNALGKKKLALAAAERAATCDPESVTAIGSLAQAQLASKKRIDALSSARRAAALNPESAFALDVLGQVLLGLKKHAEAEDAFRRALAIEPERMSARFNLALALRMQGRPEDAIDISRLLVVDDPTDADHVRAVVEAGREFVRGGPVNKAMATCFRYAALRFPALLGLLLWPFALIERRHRARVLPPETWASIEAARRSNTYRTHKRTARQNQIRWVLFILCAVIAVATLALRTL